MTEEQLTKHLLSWLEEEQWEIICFDFPQSGTGKVIHPQRQSSQSKNKGSFIPDIVAIKDKKVVFFENKDHFYLDDLVKIEDIKNNDHYAVSILKLLRNYNYTSIYYGVGLPQKDSIVVKINSNLEKIDFAVLVSEEGHVNINYQNTSIF